MFSLQWDIHFTPFKTQAKLRMKGMKEWKSWIMELRDVKWFFGNVCFTHEHIRAVVACTGPAKTGSINIQSWMGERFI